ncbi:hypothetical protein C8J57DRAFT_1563647 [Mycena rebaudengoi]|nr:hypothetical protein C8J57DRAFT_1563647 [Mycena rebaudengoi]
MFSILPLLSLATFATRSAQSLPGPPTERLAKRQLGSYNITWPDSTTAWTAGNTYNVTWFAPHSGPGSISLSTTSLDVDILLTAPFDLLRGTVNVTIPSNTTTRGDYIILLAQEGLNAETSYWAESAPFGIGEAATTSASRMSLYGSTFRFSTTIDVATTPSFTRSSSSPSSTGSGSPSPSPSPSSTGSGRRSIILPYGLALLSGVLGVVGGQL